LFNFKGLVLASHVNSHNNVPFVVSCVSNLTFVFWNFVMINLGPNFLKSILKVIWLKCDVVGLLWIKLEMIKKLLHNTTFEFLLGLGFRMCKSLVRMIITYSHEWVHVIVFQPKRKPNYNALVMDYEGSLFPISR